MVSLPADFKFPCPLRNHVLRRQAEFAEKIAGILTDFVWGPDYFGYESDSDFVEIKIGSKRVMEERHLLRRVQDITRYPDEWRKFMKFGEEYGLKEIPACVKVDEPEGSPKNHIQVSDDEAEEEQEVAEFVPAVMSEGEAEEEEDLPAIIKRFKETKPAKFIKSHAGTDYLSTPLGSFLYSRSIRTGAGAMNREECQAALEEIDQVEEQLRAELNLLPEVGEKGKKRELHNRKKALKEKIRSLRYHRTPYYNGGIV